MQPAVNWQRLLLNLRKIHALAVVAKKCDIDAATLRRLARGETLEPKFTQGVKLIDLHSDHVDANTHKKIFNNWR
jgi:hypothetical protein